MRAKSYSTLKHVLLAYNAPLQTDIQMELMVEYNLEYYLSMHLYISI